MTRYLLGRLARIVVQVFLTLSAVFIVFRAASGDPATLILGSEASAESIQELRHQMGLDRPVVVQYFHYLAGVVRGDFGMSTSYNQPVVSVMAGHIGPTVRLLAASLLISVVIGMSAGLLAALKPRSPFARGTLLLWVGLLAVPNFWLGMLLIQVFSVDLGWFPSIGDQSWISLVLPASAIAARLVALVARLTQTTVLEVLGEDFILTAKARGVGAARLIGIHALRPALPHVLTMVGLQAGYLLGGSVVVESLFSYPGMGQLLLAAVSQRDYSLMQGITIFFVLGFLLISLVVDLLSSKLDPRLQVVKAA